MRAPAAAAARTGLNQNSRETSMSSTASGARCVALALTAAVTAAVTARAAAAATDADAPAAALEEIVVTAQKREQNPQEVGISLSVLSGEDLRQLGAVTATDITRSMPAVVLTQPNGPSSFSLSIRGVTQNDFADHQESPAAVYVDDVYVSQMAGLAFSLFDMDRVEVLRGPQGTLFGRNATGGLANFVTRRPTSEDGGYLEVTTGERGLLRLEGAVNGALSDSLDGRLSFESNRYDPLFHNLAGGAPNGENGHDWALRGQLLATLPGEAQLLLAARAGREDVHAGSWEEYPTRSAGNGLDVFVGPGENPYGTCNGCNATGLPASGPFVTRDNAAGYARLETGGVTAKYVQPFDGATLTVIADHSRLIKHYQEDSDASPYTLFQFFNGSSVGQDSLEARLAGRSGALEWTAGLYGLGIDGHYYEGWQGPAYFSAQQFVSAGNPNDGYGIPGPWPYGNYATDWTSGGVPGPDGGVPATVSPYTLRTRSYAAFGQVEYRLTELVGLVLGGRYTRDDKDYGYAWVPYEYFPGNPAAPTVGLSPPAGLPLTTPYHGTRGDDLWSGKAQLDLHLTSDVLAYASYNRGVKGGGFNAPLFAFTINDPGTLSFKPETLTSTEVGLKSEFLDHTLRLNAAAYYYDYRNYQALIYTLGLEQLIVNANATHRGGEAELDWAPAPRWRLGAGIAYVDALVKDVPARCCTASGAPVYGDYVPGNAPRWSGNLSLRYTLPAFGGSLALQADGNVLSRFWFNVSDLPVVEQKPYGIANLRADWSSPSDRIEVGASVENLADTHYGVMAFDNTAINGMEQLYPGLPRWWKIRLRYRF